MIRYHSFYPFVKLAIHRLQVAEHFTLGGTVTGVTGISC